MAPAPALGKKVAVAVAVDSVDWFALSVEEGTTQSIPCPSLTKVQICIAVSGIMDGFLL